MRVIAGIAKGASLKSVSGKNTRPTTDKVKESVFNIINPYLDGGKVLDLYAGTGGLGIEALSRGMEKAIFIDINRDSIETIRSNLISTHFEEKAEIYKNDAERALKALVKRGLTFDLIILDPPYRLENYEELMQYFFENKLVNQNGIIVAEHDAKFYLPDKIETFIVIKKVVYGNIGVTIYKNQSLPNQTT